MEGFGDLAHRLIDAVRKPTLYDGHECRFGMSIGIAGAFGAEVDRQRLLVNADIALYRAKSLGRNRSEFFTEALQAEIVRNKQTADSIMAGSSAASSSPFSAAVRCAHPRTGGRRGAGALAPSDARHRGARPNSSDRRRAERAWARSTAPFSNKGSSISAAGRSSGSACRAFRSTFRCAGCATKGWWRACAN